MRYRRGRTAIVGAAQDGLYCTGEPEICLGGGTEPAEMGVELYATCHLIGDCRTEPGVFGRRR